MSTYSFFYTDSVDAALAALGEAPIIVVLPFERAEIEANQTGATLDRLLAASRSADVVHHLASSLVLQVHGYDDDLRALFKINACQRFFRTLAYAWDGWFYFLEKDAGSIPLLLSLLVELDVQHNANGTVSYQLHDLRELKEVVGRLFCGMNSVYDRYQLPDSNCRLMTKKVYAAVERMFRSRNLGQLL